MELQRGVCCLCSEKTRVFAPSDGEEFSKLLPDILYENFLTNDEFQKIKNAVKICGVCCFKIEAAVERKTAIDKAKKDKNTEDEAICHFCSTKKCLIKITSNWKYITDRTEGFVNLLDFPICACPSCLFFFDVIYTFKTKLTYKFPQLAIQKKRVGETPTKQNDTPKRKSVSKSPPSSTKRKIFNNCFTYLQPLCNNSYYVEEKLKKDARLYKKIAYVNLKNSKDIDIKETPKLRPIIKIKLKPKHRRSEKEKSNEKLVNRQSKSEEAPSKTEQNKSRKRRHSLIETPEPSQVVEEKLQETPKAASIENLVPKRRVSVYIDNAEKEIEENKDEEEDDTDKQNDKETESIAEETSVEEKPNTPEELESEPEKNEEMQENGIEEMSAETAIQEMSAENAGDVSPKIEFSYDTINGEESGETATDTAKNEELEKVSSDENINLNLSDSAEADTPTKTSVKSDSSNEGSDSDSSDNKDTNKDVSESEVLNGSERKKKRVTFSDEINE